MTNTLIEEELVLDQSLYKCMRYKLACRIRQYFNCYKYCLISVHYQKTTKYKPYSRLHKTLKCAGDKVQKCPLYNSGHTSLDKRCDSRKKEFLRIQALKKNMPHLPKVRSNISRLQITKNPRNMRPSLKPQQRSQSRNASF